MKSIVKRCSVAAVLALAALMPDFRLLNTSPEGLALIADLEGCRLTPYQCSAGVWTSGIGHTAGVVPKGDITERQAAANLVAEVLTVDGRREIVALNGGLISVADNRVSVFSQYGRLAHEISVNEAERELMEADKRLNSGDNSEETRRHHDRATAQLAAAKRAQQVR